ncbi:MAG: FmdE family protein, partial [Candidatus Methanoplasma sp.]|nr:FmdE family protein [Candidatus Methanoplasma sp.]
EIAAEALGISVERAQDEEIVCVSENDACGVDCIQFILSCTVGKGNLLFRPTGKQAYSFFDRNSGRSVRLVLKDLSRDAGREELIDNLLNGPADKIFDAKAPHFAVPEKARIFNSVICDGCGESAREDKIRLDGEKKLCLDCYKEYFRSFL